MGEPQPQPQMQMQPQPMMMGPPMMAAGPCPMCGNAAPPMMVYDINVTGWVVIIILFFFPLPPISGLIAACIICGEKQQPDSCHDPKGKCASCGALRIG